MKMLRSGLIGLSRSCHSPHFTRICGDATPLRRAPIFSGRARRWFRFATDAGFAHKARSMIFVY